MHLPNEGLLSADQLQGCFTRRHVQQAGLFEHRERFLGQPIPPRPLDRQLKLDDWAAECLRRML